MDNGNVISLIDKFHSLNLSDNIDFDKFNHYAITHHSTTIEGTTLTEIETRLLLDEGITPAGKPLQHSLMVKDHHDALLYIIKQAALKTIITPEFLQNINSRVMNHTGSIYQTVFGEVNGSMGAFRKGNVSAGNTYFVSFDKVEGLIKKLCDKMADKFLTISTVIDKINICFDAHFDLVTIHPFYDGNGRTSRLLMNYLQMYCNLPMSIVFKEDKAAYFEALDKTRKQEDITVFRKFMYAQYEKYLLQEIEKFEAMNKANGNSRGYSFVF